MFLNNRRFGYINPFFSVSLETFLTLLGYLFYNINPIIYTIASVTHLQRTLRSLPDMASNFLIWKKAELLADNLCAVNQSESWKFNNRD